MILNARLVLKRFGGLLLACVFLLAFCHGGAAAQDTAGGMTLTADEFALADDGLYAAEATLEGMAGTGAQPLYDVTLDVALTDSALADGSLWLGRVGVYQTSAVAVTVQTRDASGANNDVQKTLTEGLELELPEGTCGVMLRYFSAESDFRLMPAGFEAGKIRLEARCRAGEPAPVGTVATLRANASMEARGSDGAEARIAAQTAELAFPMDKSAFSGMVTSDTGATPTVAAPAAQAPAFTSAPAAVLAGLAAPTEAPAPTNAPAPALTEAPAPAPTHTPMPTSTPTPAPTATPAPTPTPEPVIVTVAVQGCAYMDANGSLVREDSEQLMSGVQVWLQRLDNGSWTEVASALTDEYGQYAFTQDREGEYRVCAYTDAAGFFVAAVGSEARFADGTAAMCGGTLALANGQTNAGMADVALQASASLHVTAFSDSNADGARGQYERAAQGVQVDVVDGDAVLAAGVTDSNGEALLQSVRPGEHRLRFTAPESLAFTAAGADSVVGEAEADGATALSAPYAFAAGQTVSAGIGVTAIGSFSGKVFEDLNNDGVMDENDPGVAGVVLRLEGQRKGNVYTFTTDETGLYRFSRVPNDLYVFSAELPEGMLYARYSKTGGDLRSVFSGSVLTREFAVSNAANVTDKNVGVVQKGVLKGTAFLDLNYNGYLDEGEPGFEGVTLEAIKLSNNESLGRTVSDKDGAFRIENLRGGDYRLRAILPDNGAIFTAVPAAGGENANYFAQRSTRRENSIQPISIISGGEASALVGVAVGATVRGTVYQDSDYNGSLTGKEKKLSGVRVQLADEAGNVVAAATTNGEGKYALGGIMPGIYVVQVKRTAGNGFTRLRPNEDGGSHVVELIGDYGVTAPMTIAMGQVIENVNAGMLPSSTVTGKLFNDLNDDGLPSEGEAGLTEATVRLLSGDGEIDLVRPVGEDGTYFFDGVMPGEYTLTFRLPEHTEIARVAAGGNTLENAGRETETGSFTVAMGEAYEYPLVGGVVLGSFEGAVFKDANANGVQDEREDGLSGAKVTLTPDRKSAEELTMKTGRNGAFKLNGLRPAQYQLSLELPDGYIFSHSLDADGLALDAAATQKLSCPWSVLTNRAPKAIGAVKPASIAGAVWLDENKDGSRAKEELLLSGLSLELVDESTQKTVARVKSTDSGFLFDSVRPGAYTVRFTMPAQAEPAADSASTFAFAAPYMQQAGVVVGEGQRTDGLSTGLVSKTSIGGKVLLEEDGTAPVPGVTVSLYLPGESDPLQTAVTGEDGSYRFDGLWPGDYVIEASLPDGMIFVRPDDPNFEEGASVIADIGESAGRSAAFPLKMAQHQLDRRILYIRPAKLGDQVWLDENRNGLIDGGESMIPGVKIALVQNGEPVYETVSDAFGYYLFGAVYPGAYTLVAEAYPELTVTVPAENLRIISSCLTSGDGGKAYSDEFSVESGETDLDFNLGYVVKDGQPTPAAITEPPSKNWTVNNQKYTQMQE